VAVKGVVLAGGLGTRLLPLTRVTNKHLLPVYNRPMIFYPLRTLVDADITDILIVTGGNSAGDFLKLLGNGKEFGLKHLNYTYQEGEGGIAAALSLAEHFADGDPICVILGDNIIEDNILEPVRRFRETPTGAQIFLKKVPDPERFGVPELRGDRVVRIEEKPKRPRSGYAVTGLYFYDAKVFDVVRTLRPSRRGELEITDVNNWYIRRHELSYAILDGWWTDAGTFESLYRASQLVANTDGGRSGRGARPGPASRRRPAAARGRRARAKESRS
jgi:glucose-1-phosphate thymidylyltransferase